jgi:hypothetical protein
VVLVEMGGWWVAGEEGLRLKEEWHVMMAGGGCRRTEA